MIITLPLIASAAVIFSLRMYDRIENKSERRYAFIEYDTEPVYLYHCILLMRTEFVLGNVQTMLCACHVCMCVSQTFM